MVICAPQKMKKKKGWSQVNHVWHGSSNDFPEVFFNEIDIIRQGIYWMGMPPRLWQSAICPAQSPSYEFIQKLREKKQDFKFCGRRLLFLNHEILGRPIFIQTCHKTTKWLTFPWVDGRWSRLWLARWFIWPLKLYISSLCWLDYDN